MQEAAGRGLFAGCAFAPGDTVLSEARPAPSPVARHLQQEQHLPGKPLDAPIGFGKRESPVQRVFSPLRRARRRMWAHRSGWPTSASATAAYGERVMMTRHGGDTSPTSLQRRARSSVKLASVEASLVADASSDALCSALRFIRSGAARALERAGWVLTAIDDLPGGRSSQPASTANGRASAAPPGGR